MSRPHDLKEPVPPGTSPRPSEFLAPWPLLAVAVMALNDHVLKAAFHNAVTGKLSDLAICFFLPLYVSGALGLIWPGSRGLRLAAGAVVAATTFVLLEMSDVMGASFLHGLRTVGPPLGIQRVELTRDPTDLLALVMVPFAVWYGSRRLAR